MKIRETSNSYPIYSRSKKTRVCLARRWVGKLLKIPLLPPSKVYGKAARSLSFAAAARRRWRHARLTTATAAERWRRWWLLPLAVGGRGLSLGNKTRRKGLLVVARTLDDSKALLPLKQKRKKKIVFLTTLYHSLAAFGG